MVGYISKQAGQQFPRSEMPCRYHARALPSFETLQQVRALHVKQGMGQAEFGNKDRLEERTSVVREAGPRQRLRRCVRNFKVPGDALRSETAAFRQACPEQGAKPLGKRTDTGKAELAEQKGETIAHPAHGPGKRLGKLMEQGRRRRQLGRFQGLKLFLKAAALARYGFWIADIAFDAVGVGAHHRNPAERQRKLETIPAFEDLAPFHEQTDGHDGRVRTGGEEYRAFLDFMARAARAVHGHAAADPGLAHPAGGGKKGLHPAP